MLADKPFRWYGANSVDMSTTWTWSFWLYHDNSLTSISSIFISIYNTAGNLFVQIRPNLYNNQVYVKLGQSTQSAEMVFDTSSVKEYLNSWTHFALDMSNTVTKLYINGVLITSQTYTNVFLGSYRLQQFQVGVDTGSMTAPNPSMWLKTLSIDDFRMYTRSLSANEIQLMFNPCLISGQIFDETTQLCNCRDRFFLQNEVCVPKDATRVRTTSAAQQFYMDNRPYVHYKATKYQFVNNYLQLLDIGSGQNRHSQAVNSKTREIPECFVTGMSTANSYGGKASIPIIKFSVYNYARPYLTTGVGTVTDYFTVCGVMRSLGAAGSSQQFMGRNGVDMDINLGYAGSINDPSMVKVSDVYLDHDYDPYPVRSAYTGPRNNWQVICVKNDWLQCPSVRINGVGSQYQCLTNNPNNRYSPLSKEGKTPGAYYLEDPLEFNQLVSWNRLLTPAEFQLVSDTLVTYLDTGIDPFLCAENMATTCGDDFWTCNAGYTGPYGGPCTACSAGQYKSVTSNAACTSCPVGTFSNAVGASVCTACLPGTYSNALGVSACTRCPAGTASNVSGATSVGSCLTCESGLYSFTGASSCSSIASLTCSACPANTYFAGSTCAPCPSNTVSVAGSATCQCSPGFTGTPGACQACPVGTYKRLAGTSACRSCQANSLSQSGSALCACGPGYTGNNGDVCIACVSGKYKNVTGSAACIDCAAMRNSPAAAPNVTSCVCNVGYTQVEDAALTFDVVYARACVACEAGKFKGLTGVQACTTCPQNQSSLTARTICSCVAGFTGPDGGPCAECARGTYKDWLGSQVCTTCPADSYTPFTGNTLLSNCTCNIGYTGPNGGPCPGCVGGKYKNVTGTSACITCDANFYSTLAYAATSCSACPAGYQSLPRTAISADCCGFNSLPQYGRINLARSCGALGDQGCPAYAPNFFRNDPVSFGPQNVVNDIWDNGYISACCGGSQWWMVDFQRTVDIQYVVIFNSGWRPDWLANFNLQLSYDGGTFTNCATRQYGDTGANGLISTHACVGSARFLRLTQSTEFLQLAEVLVYGPAIHTSPYDSIRKETSCPCNMGYTGAMDGASKGQCTTCPAGTYKPTNGSAACTLCPANTYSSNVHATSNSTCLKCAVSSVTVPGETICFCQAGFTGPDGGPCEMCEAGKYKNWRNASVCPLCPPNSDSVAGTTLCPCNVGYTGPLGGPCVACVPGKYKDTNGTAACTTCPANSYEPDLAATVVTNCTCNTGFEGADGGPCTACALGKYKDTNDSVSCVSCPMDTYIDVQASAYCKACPQFTTSIIGSVSVIDCNCKSGYTGPGGGATVLVYSSNLARTCGTNSNQACLSAASTTRGGTTSNALDNDVNTLFITESGGDQWFKIDFGKVVNVQSFTIVVVYSWEVDYQRNIKVRVGNVDSYSSLLNPTCYEHVGSLITLGAGVPGWTRTISCTTPREGQYLFYVNPPGLNYIEFGEFSVQGFLPAAGIPCSACGRGKYKPSIGDSECTSCGVRTYSEAVNATSVDTCLECQGNSTSIAGSPSKMFCQCNVGFLHEGEECAMCSPGTYNSELGRTACSTCSIGLYSVNYQATSNETCLLCPAGQWSPEGSPVCMDCPANSAAPPRMGRIVDCACNVGYTGPGGGPCVQCEVGKYKNTTGYWPCSTCPAYSSSGLASVKITDCFCNSGFYGVNGLPCTGCVLGKYKAVPGTSACQLCPVNTYSDSIGVSVCTPCVSTSSSANGSTSIWNCTCNAGYTGPTYQGVQSNTNFARSCGNGSQACPTTQSSNFMSFTADMAVDGTTLTRSNTMFASSQWWRVDFGRRVTITSVAIFFSQHSIDTLVIHVGDGQSALENNICSSVNFYGTADEWKTVNCSTATTGRYLHVRNTVGSIVGFREIQPVGSEIVTMVWPGYCESCKAGFFKTTTGNQVCSPCPANTFSNMTTAIFAETCIPCASNAVSGTGSTFCQCDVGFTSESGSCVACPFGKFKSVVGSSACNVCSPNSVGLENTRETCACVAGYELSWSNV